MKKTPTYMRPWIGSAAFLLAAALAAAAFLSAFAPTPVAEPVRAADACPPAPMEQALSPDAVRSKLDAILAFGSRYPGQDGFRKTEAFIRKSYAAAGLKVYELPHEDAIPVTVRRDIAGADGRALDGVEVFPFLPNHCQPPVTPAGGLRGTLAVLTPELLKRSASFAGLIAVLDLSRPPPMADVSWSTLSELGFEALIVTHRDGLEHVAWDRLSACGAIPVNVVRVAATPRVLEHDGETVTLRVRVEWQRVASTTFVGVLASSGAPAREAVMNTAAYDACSVLPDLAPGPLSAMGLAVQLAMLDSLPAYRRAGLRRDAVFVAYAANVMGRLAADRLSAVVGPSVDRAAADRIWRREQQQNDATLAGVRECLSAAGSAGFLEDPAATLAGAARLSPAARSLLSEELAYILNDRTQKLGEIQLLARLNFLRAGSRVPGGEYETYLDAKRSLDAALMVAGYPLGKLVEARDGGGRPSVAREAGLSRLFRQRMAALQAQGQARDLWLARAREVHGALRPYERLIATSSWLIPQAEGEPPGERLAVSPAGVGASGYAEPLAALNDVVTSVGQSLTLPAGCGVDSIVPRRPAALPVVLSDLAMWGAKGYPAFSLMHSDRADRYRYIGYPVELPFMRNTASMRWGLRVYGRVMLALLQGQGRFEAPRRFGLLSYGGRVYVAGVGRSIVPNFPMKDALIGHKWDRSAPDVAGQYEQPFYFADASGRYALPLTSAALAGVSGYSPEAFGFGQDGTVAYVKDEGPLGQAVYKSMRVGWLAARARVNMVTFRAEPLTVLDRVNPQTLRTFSSVAFLRRDGLDAVRRSNVFAAGQEAVQAFLEPDSRVYVTFRSGASDNPLVQTVRAFSLNLDSSSRPDPAREIDGRGYLCGDRPVLRDAAGDIARSMVSVNGRRLALQERYAMADERTREFHQRSEALLAEAGKPGLPRAARELLHREAACYAILNHPELRRSIGEAVVGVLWYLGLLVPFVIFFEKLVFGFADIRKQLTAQALVFLAAFLLLRLLHPAFRMIQSSLMILLGFVILLISSGVTLLSAGRFRENFEELKRKRGRVTAAEVNTLGAMATAFSLGLNNMHRRRVRTGLTCATLVLLTFAMIAFTSASSTRVSTFTAIGKAPYQGFLVRRENLAPMSPAELRALRARYADRHVLSPRTLVVGAPTWDQLRKNPEIDAVNQPTAGDAVRAPVASVLTFGADEPLAGRIVLLTTNGWFASGAATDAAAPSPVLLPDALARALKIPVEAVNAGPVVITLGGRSVRVQGIFDSESLASLRDLDGRNLLPFDLEAMTSFRVEAGGVLAADDDPRLPAGGMVLALEGASDAMDLGGGQVRLTSVAVSMPGAGYAEARAEIDKVLEQTGQVTYAGLDGLAYVGQRAHRRTVAGLIELLIPLAIAAMTVLNTMRGSVYERRDEIFVYNAVGIAPRYIFSMFLSEAFVYSVVGSVLGYILSQGVGRLLTLLGMTGGLNMTYTSLTTVYASLAIMAAAFLSTVFPARSAMRMAETAEESGWRLPEPEGDRMAFALPFTFHADDRIAVLAFFHRYLEDHGEGGAGTFHAGMPACGVADDPLNAAYAPTMITRVWLKPFDLGVSQDLTLTLPRDPETGEFIATVALDRLSGSRESWVRLNRSFVREVRRHFLHWRAVSPAQRAELLVEARAMLEEPLREGLA